MGIALDDRATEELFSDVKLYQEIVGCLIYLSTTSRPGISFAVGVVSRYMNSPKVGHWSIVKGIIRYLKGTIHFGLKFGSMSLLNAFADASWGSDLATRRSIIGYLINCGGPVLWKSKRQTTVALSTVEAEYMALSAVTQELALFKMLMEELHISWTSAVVYQDNQGTIKLTQSSAVNERTKHIDIRHHFVREKVADETIKVQYCDTNSMLADIFTKALPATQFCKLRELRCWKRM